MQLPNDPVMLMSFVNTRLRDGFDSLDALCDDLGIANGSAARASSMTGAGTSSADAKKRCFWAVPTVLGSVFLVFLAVKGYIF